jgi:hypothetical protein
MKALEAIFGKKKIVTRSPTGSSNPARTNNLVNGVGKGMKWGGRVLLVFMVYSEYKKIAAADDWRRQLGSCSSGVLGAIGGGAVGGAAVGAGLGSRLGPVGAAGGAIIGGLVGGAVGYDLASGGFEWLYDVLYEE